MHFDIKNHEFLTSYCADCAFPRRIRLSCGDRTCPVCSEARFGALLEGYYDFLKTKKVLRFITLTLKDCSLSEEKIDYLRRCFIRLRRMRYYKAKLIGGVYGIEAKKRIGRNWYIHMHILAEGTYIEQRRLSRDWFRITGNAFRVDIRRFKNGIAGLKYITKYMTKPPSVGRSKNLYNSVMHKARLVQTFGTWYKVKSRPRPCVCPVCGCKDWISEYKLNWYSINSYPYEVSMRSP